MKTKLLTTLVAVSLMSLMTSRLFAFSGGTGSEADPYQIASAADLQELHTVADWKHFILTADIDMAAESWVPLSSASHATQFRGHINGDGFVIKNLTISDETAVSKIGFIIEQAGGTYIKNLGFESLTVNAPNAIPVGGIIAYSWGGNNRLFENNWVKNGSITGKDNVGALAGWMYVNNENGGNMLKNCYAGENVIVSGNKAVGGLFGRLALQVDGRSEDMCFFGTVAADSSASPIAGELKGGSVDFPNSYYYDASKNDLTVLSALPQGSASVGAAVGVASADLGDQSKFPELDFVNVWSMGLSHPQLSEPAVAFASLVSVMTATHDDLSDPQGGAYEVEDTVTLQVKYVSNMDSKITLVFKENDPEKGADNFKVVIFPKLLVDLPSSANDTIIQTIKVEIPDTVSYLGGSRISAYLGTWALGKDKYEFVSIVDQDVTVTEQASVELPIVVYPNPTQGTFWLSVAQQAEVYISDMSGKRVLHTQVESGSNAIDLSANAPGIYILCVKTAQGCGMKRLLVK